MQTIQIESVTLKTTKTGKEYYSVNKNISVWDLSFGESLNVGDSVDMVIQEKDFNGKTFYNGSPVGEQSKPKNTVTPSTNTHMLDEISKKLDLIISRLPYEAKGITSVMTNPTLPTTKTTMTVNATDDSIIPF